MVLGCCFRWCSACSVGLAFGLLVGCDFDLLFCWLCFVPCGVV